MMKKNFIRKKKLDIKEILTNELIKSMTDYYNHFFSTNINYLILRVFRSNRWEVALACGFEKIYEKLLKERNFITLIATFRVALNSNFPHILSYLKQYYEELINEDKILLLNDLLTLESYNWRNLILFTSYYNIPIEFKKLLTTRGSIICQNNLYFSSLHKSFLTPNLRKFVIKQNVSNIYYNFPPAKNLLSDWSLAIRFKSYSIVQCLRKILLSQEKSQKITENSLRHAMYQSNFSLTYLEIFFFNQNNIKVLNNYKYSSCKRICSKEKIFFKSLKMQIINN